MLPSALRKQQHGDFEKQDLDSSWSQEPSPAEAPNMKTELCRAERLPGPLALHREEMRPDLFQQQTERLEETSLAAAPEMKTDERRSERLPGPLALQGEEMDPDILESRKILLRTKEAENSDRRIQAQIPRMKEIVKMQLSELS